MQLVFDKYPYLNGDYGIITVKKNDTSVSCQQLLNAIRDYEDNPEGMDLPSIAVASGKEDLGGGILIGITLKLIDWKVEFEDRLPPTTIACEVTGGNLVCWDSILEEYVNPILASDFTQVTRTVAASATIAPLSPGDLAQVLNEMNQLLNDNPKLQKIFELLLPGVFGRR